MFNLISSVDIITNTIVTFIGILFFFAPLLFYKIFNSYWSTFFEWISDSLLGMLASFFSLIIAAVLVIMGGISLFNNVVDIHENKIMEPAIYEKMIICGDTYRDALEYSTDIINTDLYLDIVKYNEQLTIIKSKSKIPNYSFNFSGNYDWDALEHIDLIEE